MKHVPFLERLVSSSTTDLYDAIFDIEVTHDLELFHDSDDEDHHPALSSHVSHDSLRARAPSPTLAGRALSRSQSRRQPSVPRTPTSPTRRERYDGSPRSSPFHRVTALPSLLEPSASGEIQTVGPRSPLSRLFTTRRDFSASQERLNTSAAVDQSVKKLEGMIEEIRHLPVNRLKEEMKELQVQIQAFYGIFTCLCRDTFTRSDRRELRICYSCSRVACATKRVVILPYVTTPCRSTKWTRLRTLTRQRFLVSGYFSSSFSHDVRRQ